MADQTLSVKIIGDSSSFVAAAEKVEEKVDAIKAKASGSAIEKIGASFQSAGSKVTKFGKSLAPVSAAAGAVSAGIVKVTKDTAEYTDNIDKMSQKLGMSRKAYQEWSYVLSQAGVDIDSMQVGMKTLTNKIDDCRKAGSTSGKAFDELGISHDDLAGKSREDIFKMTIQALQRCEDETKRAALANDLFGKSGQNLAPLLNETAESTDALMQKARDLGFVLDDSVIDQGVAMTDAMDTMKRSFMTVGAGIATAVMPLLTQFAEWSAANMPKVTKKIQELVKKFQSLSPTLQKIILLILPITAALSPVIMMVGKIISTVGTVIGLVGKVGKALSGLFSLMAANPIFLIIAAIAALVLGFIYLWNHCEGFRQFWMKLWDSIKDYVVPVVQFIGTLIKTVFGAISGFIAEHGETIKRVFSVAWAVIKALVVAHIQAIATVVKTVMKVVETVINTTMTVIRAIVTAVTDFVHTQIINRFNAIKDKVTLIFATIQAVTTSTWNGIKSTVSGIVDGIYNTITGKVQSAADKVKKIWQTVKDTLAKKISLPHINLPHIKVSGKLSLNPPSVPKFSIDWYAKGGIFNRASVIGVGEGHEPEAVTPISKLKAYVADAVTSAKTAVADNSAIDGLARAISGGFAMQNAQPGGEYRFIVELGGARVAEKVYKLNKEGKMIMEG